MSIESRRLRAVAAVSLLSLATLTACASPSDEPTATDAAVDATAPEEVEEEAATGPECLIGDWYIAEDQMQSFYSAVSGTNEGLDITVEGGTGLAFTATSYTYTPDFAILLQVAGTEGTGAITGGISGEYSATETVITTSQEVSDIAVTVTVSGVTMDGADLTNSFLASAPINSAPYECGAEGPLLQFSTGEGKPTVPIQLTAAG
ncbi:hypothetical protein I6E68_12465 [Salinibacterium sp. NSLL150]|uniref:hypothetical protein n=1 Tax=unclassified Salinibacterium TaxID=2632331 RepID=UPI0018CCF72E|nr:MULTISPECIES: hypothetical protein [unclassified Salinibacterium]MBH0099946.1 hypothetical protein [Salinibacterium sp. NSLL35]MBH0102700.1 hypothetical protein [Salinibacterium sp. NSLL150]MBH0105460.1 hypothetical protein [Salinibacterium sp. NSLL16]MBH0108220.1 hypothetical protein [Salinibacterium sp. NSLL17]